MDEHTRKKQVLSQYYFIPARSNYSITSLTFATKIQVADFLSSV